MNSYKKLMNQLRMRIFNGTSGIQTLDKGQGMKYQNQYWHRYQPIIYGIVIGNIECKRSTVLDLDYTVNWSTGYLQIRYDRYGISRYLKPCTRLVT